MEAKLKSKIYGVLSNLDFYIHQTSASYTNLTHPGPPLQTEPPPTNIYTAPLLVHLYPILYLTSQHCLPTNTKSEASK